VKSDESPSQIRNWTISNCTVQFTISDFGFEMREAQARQREALREDSSDFKMSPISAPFQLYLSL
jgi:hypothetical protein